tara:strand:+ start:66 stop:434 length:369 start_codon:yes stop_codon:yes gene_type:complete
MNEVITKYNEDFANVEKFDEETCFYMQLTHDEKDEYVDMQITHLKSRISNLNDEIFMNDFQRERNHPDRELYRTDSNSMTPSDEYVELLEENLVDLYKKQKSLDNEIEFQKSLNFITESEVA